MDDPRKVEAPRWWERLSREAGLLRWQERCHSGDPPLQKGVEVGGDGQDAILEITRQAQYRDVLVEPRLSGHREQIRGGPYHCCRVSEAA
ncbi:hypothetical protein [Sphingobium sp. SCG-1]|uniref:hypothetical protein n=1 Tax=Sphingobium sp. SCG-1 TaxID=2072936 RepID=UPI001CB9B00A|nr:hypothetical protein [Sphingobium sp. SCG-1]